mmetsp:Transcript_63105/g.150433  ORF Transcript_63105/g.150433 Transcript_63105/m.150433 type:complete len:798 (+) Transcript_63105:33-2426(+)
MRAPDRVQTAGRGAVANLLGMEPILTFEAELCKAAPGARLGIDIVLFSSEHGGGLVVERVHDGGQVEAWNRQSVEPRKIRPGDFIVRVNGVEGDVSALADELRVGKDLSLTVHRSRAADNPVRAVNDNMIPVNSNSSNKNGSNHMEPPDMPWQMQQLASCGGPQGMDPTMNRVMPLNQMQGLSAGGGARNFSSCGGSQQARRPGPCGGVSGINPWSQSQMGSQFGRPDHTGSQFDEYGLGGSRATGMGYSSDIEQTFEAVLSKPAGMRLGIDVLSSGWDLGGVMVKRVAGSGAVAVWNQTHSEALQIKTGDVIVSANGVTTNFEQMMEELRSSQELRLIVMRGGSSGSSAPLQPPAGVPNIMDNIPAGGGVQPTGLMNSDFQNQHDGLPGLAGLAEASARGWRDDAGLHGCQSGPKAPGFNMGKRGKDIGHLQPPPPPPPPPPPGPDLSGGFGIPSPDSMPMPADWQDKGEMGSDGQTLWFTVKLEKSVGERLGIVIKLMGDNLMVEQVPDGGCVGEWNRRSRPPYRVQPGDFIVQVNGIRQWQSLHRMVEEFARDCKQVTLTVQRSTHRANNTTSPAGGSMPLHGQCQQGSAACPGGGPPAAPPWPPSTSMAPPSGPPPLSEEAKLLAQRRAMAASASARPEQGMGGCAPPMPNMRPPMPQGLSKPSGGGGAYPSGPNLGNIPLPEVGGASGLKNPAGGDSGERIQPKHSPPAGPAPWDVPNALQGAGAAAGIPADDLNEAASNRSPVNLLRSMLELNDQELGRVLRFMLERRPWLREPVAKALGRSEEDPKLVLQ